MIHALRAEWTKALTSWSIRGAACAALVVPPLIALASGLSFDPSTPASQAFPIESHGFQTAGFGQALVIVLVTLMVGSEYAGGQVRTTLLAEPRRGRVLAAKLITVAVVAAVVGIVSTSAAVVVEHRALGGDGLRIHQFTVGMAWNLVGVALNFSLTAVMAAAVAVLTRSIVVPVAVLVPLVLGLSLSMLALLPFLTYSPDLAGIQMLTSYPGIGLLEPIPGAFVMAAWAAVLGLASWASFRRRDIGGS